MDAKPKRTPWKIQPDTTVQVVNSREIKEEYLDNRRNWYGIAISLAIIFFIGMLIVIATMIVIPIQTPAYYGRRLRLEDIEDPGFAADPMGFQWMSDNELTFISENGSLIVRDIRRKSIETLIDSLTLVLLRVKEFSVSSNLQYVLLLHDTVEGRLFKKRSKYTVFDVKTRSYFPLKMNPRQLDHPRYQHARWLPQKTRDKAAELIIVNENDIFYMSGPQGSVTKLSFSGKEHELYNGVPDLMYEEILRTSSTIWPSPASEYVAYLSLNDSQVAEVPTLKYENEELPVVVPFRYATVKSQLPKVSIWVVELRNPFGNNSRWRLTPPPPISQSENYVLGIGWVGDSTLWISWVSRDQSTTLLATCSEGKKWQCSKVYMYHENNKISPAIQNLAWSDLWVAFPWPNFASNSWWYNQISVVGADGGSHPTPSLKAFHVDAVVALQPTSMKIFFLGSRISEGSEEQQLFVVSGLETPPKCISCSVDCSRLSASPNEGLTYAVLSCLDTLRPSLFLIDLESDTIIPLHTQDKLRRSLENIALPIMLYEDIFLSASIQASIVMSIPPGWDKTDDSFSLGIENYEGVGRELRLGWQEFLSSRYQVAHANIKLWGGDLSKYHSTKTMGAHLNNIIKILLDKFTFLDGTQVSLWGSGSGASLALELVGIDDSKFNCVLAINPVADWSNYASYWAERLLGPLGYAGSARHYYDSNILSTVTSLTHAKILLIQGSADPLSHHSSNIAKTLIENGKYFQHIVYPEGDVSLRREVSHVIQSMENFILRQECIRSFYNDENT